MDISAIAERTIRRAGVVGVLPTPVDYMIASERLDAAVDPEPFIQRFVRRIAEDAREVFMSGIQKLRGIADLRDRAIYVPSELKPTRARWAKSHELGHQLLPWHNVNMGYTDDDRTLRADAQELFDLEANFFASEVIFQSRRFQRLARDYTPSLQAVFVLADQHGASRQATLWRFVQDHDDVVASVLYWPSSYVYDADGNRVLTRGKSTVMSASFAAKHSDILFPPFLPSDHPWFAAFRERDGVEGEINLQTAGREVPFQWFSWWNTYCLLVLVRRRPILHRVGALLT